MSRKETSTWSQGVKATVLPSTFVRGGPGEIVIRGKIVCRDVAVGVAEGIRNVNVQCCFALIKFNMKKQVIANITATDILLVT